MKKAIAVFSIGAMLLGSVEAQQPVSPQSHSVLIRGGQGLKFSTLKPLSSATAREGDDVPLRLDAPFTWGSITLIPQGEVVHARVEKVKHPKPECSNGEITLKLDHLAFVDKTQVDAKIAFTNPKPDYPVQAQFPDDHISPWAIGLLSPLIAAVGAIAGPYALGDIVKRRCPGLGNDYVLPENATVAVRITKDYNVKYCYAAGSPGEEPSMSLCP